MAKQKTEEKKTQKTQEEVRLPDVKLFGKYETTNIAVKDPGLTGYINLRPQFVPKSQGRKASKRFGKSEMHIVERLINSIGPSGHKGKGHWRTSGRNIGKMMMATNHVLNAFKIIEDKLNKNPIEVLVRAVENSAPMQETIVIEYGGIRHPKCVDVAPQRRIDLALRWITQGAFQQAATNKTTIERTIANELINASQNSNQSFAVSKKIEVERQAVASR